MHTTTFIPFAAVDVGYSHTKHVHEASTGAEHADNFPSVTAVVGGRPLGTSAYKKENVHFLDLPSGTFVTGPDARNYVDQVSAVVDQDFCLTDRYLALYRTALYRMALNALDTTPTKVPHVTILRMVGGLPLTTLAKHRAALERRMAGVHVLPPVPGRTEPLTVVVRQAAVIAQPEGALLHAVNTAEDYEHDFGQSANLVIDVGGGTTDWYRSTGNAPIHPQCGAHATGMTHFVDAVCDLIDPALKDNLPIRISIDQALRSQVECFKIGTHTLQMAEVIPAVSRLCAMVIGQMRAQVKHVKGLDIVLLAGGGAGLLKRAMDSVDPELSALCTVSTDPIYANVRGFLVMAELQAERVAA